MQAKNVHRSIIECLKINKYGNHKQIFGTQSFFFISTELHYLFKKKEVEIQYLRIICGVVSGRVDARGRGPG